MMNGATKLAAVGVIGAVTLTAAPAAQSALVCGSGSCTDLITLGPSPTEIVGGVINLPLFDSTIGTLTGATITFKATNTVKAGSSVTNFAFSPLTLKVQNTVTFSLKDTTAPAGAIDLAVKAMTLAPTTGVLTFTNVPGSPSAPLNKVAIGPLNFSASANLLVTLADLQVAGGGTHALSVGTKTKTSILAGGDLVGSKFLNDAQLAIDVLYLYDGFTDAPEPLSIGMLGVGLAALGGAQIARRRKKNETMVD